MVTFRVIEAALPVIGGVIVGLAVGLSLGAGFGHRAGLDGSSVLSRSIDGSLALRLGAVSLLVWVLISVT